MLFYSIYLIIINFLPNAPDRKSVLIPFGEWSSSTGGIATINRTISKQLAKKDESFLVCLYVPDGNISLDEEREAESHGVTVLYADPITGIEDRKDKYVWTCFPPNALPKPDVVFGHARFYGPAAHCIRRFSPNTKWVQWVHMASEELGTYKKKDDGIMEGRERDNIEVKLCEEADAVVAIGPHLAEMYEWDLAYCNKTINIIYPGIFTDLADVPHRDKDSKPFSVLVFGRGAEEDFEIKGYDIAAKSVAVLGEDYRLVMVGAEPEKIEEMVDKLVEVSKVEGKYLRRGSQLLVQPFCSQKEMRKKFSQADLILMPSRAEGFGLTALEAISAGVPVLVSKYSGLAEALMEVQGGDAVVVRSDSYKDWAYRIEQNRKLERKVRLDQADTLRENFGKKYSWTNEVDRLSKILEQLFPGRPNPHPHPKPDIPPVPCPFPFPVPSIPGPPGHPHPQPHSPPKPDVPLIPWPVPSCPGPSIPGTLGALEDKVSCSEFLTKVQTRYSWDENIASDLVLELENEEINTLAALKECWDDIDFNQLGIGGEIRRSIEKELNL